MKQYRAFVWKQARDYLSSLICPPLIDEYMALAAHSQPKDLPTVYRRLLESLSNRQGMPNSIGKISCLSNIFYDFDHKKTLGSYSQWTDLFDTIKVKADPSSRMEREDPHNYWTIFCKGSLSAAKYLSRFNTLSDLLTFVNDFDAKPSTRPALPLLLEKEIFGFGFALACNFLMEIGFANFCKPDVHLLDIFSGLGLADRTAIDVFRVVSLMADENGQTPYAIDKVFWLIGSGNLYNHDKRFQTNKKLFIQQTLTAWRNNP